MSVDEIAAHFDVTRGAIYKRMLLRNLPALGIGRLWELKPCDVDG